jgi:hypothetical protein
VPFTTLQLKAGSKMATYINKKTKDKTKVPQNIKAVIKLLMPDIELVKQGMKSYINQVSSEVIKAFDEHSSLYNDILTSEDLTFNQVKCLHKLRLSYLRGTEDFNNDPLEVFYEKCQKALVLGEFIDAHFIIVETNNYNNVMHIRTSQTSEGG